MDYPLILGRKENNISGWGSCVRVEPPSLAEEEENTSPKYSLRYFLIWVFIFAVLHDILKPLTEHWPKCFLKYLVLKNISSLARINLQRLICNITLKGDP